MRFAEPYSLQSLIVDQTSRRSAVGEGPTFDIKAHEEDKQTFLRQLGYRVLSDINCQPALLSHWMKRDGYLTRSPTLLAAASVAMPSALVATALLTLRTDRVRLSLFIRLS